MAEKKRQKLDPSAKTGPANGSFIEENQSGNQGTRLGIWDSLFEDILPKDAPPPAVPLFGIDRGTFGSFSRSIPQNPGDDPNLSLFQCAQPAFKRMLTDEENFKLWHPIRLLKYVEVASELRKAHPDVSFKKLKKGALKEVFEKYGEQYLERGRVNVKEMMDWLAEWKKEDPKLSREESDKKIWKRVGERRREEAGEEEDEDEEDDEETPKKPLQTMAARRSAKTKPYDDFDTPILAVLTEKERSQLCFPIRYYEYAKIFVHLGIEKPELSNEKKKEVAMKEAFEKYEASNYENSVMSKARKRRADGQMKIE